MGFFDTYIGNYLVQSTLHSLVALLTIEAALNIFKISDALSRYRYRVALILMSVASYPLFQLLFPTRGSFYFRQDHAIFDSTNWFQLNLYQGISIGLLLFIGTTGTTTALVVIQEWIPLVRELVSKQTDDSDEDSYGDSLVQKEQLTRETLAELSEQLQIREPELVVNEDPRPLLFVSGTDHRKIILSTCLLESLTEAQLQAALAHELAHIKLRSNTRTLALFLIKNLMFFNPIGMLAFRWVIQNDEHLCDDIAVQLTGGDTPLAEALGIFITGGAEELPDPQSRLSTIEEHSHNLLLKERIDRLTAGEALNRKPFSLLTFLLVLIVATTINFYIT